jgi:hypothetical protein
MVTDRLSAITKGRESEEGEEDGSCSTFCNNEDREVEEVEMA